MLESKGLSLNNNLKLYTVVYLSIKILLHLISKFLIKFNLVKSNSFRAFNENQFLLYTTIQELLLGLSVFYLTDSLPSGILWLSLWHVILYYISNSVKSLNNLDYLIMFKKHFNETITFIGYIPIILSHIIYFLLHKTNLIKVFESPLTNFFILFFIYILSIVSFEDI